MGRRNRSWRVRCECRASLRAPARQHGVEEDGGDQHDADDDENDFVLLPLPAYELAGFVDEQDAQDGAGDSSAAAEDAGAAEDDGGDDVELHGGADVGFGGVAAGDEENRGNRLDS